GLDALEKRRREVALAGIRKHAEDHRAFRGPFRYLPRGGEGRTSRDTGENPLPARQFTRPMDRVGTGDWKHLVAIALVEGLLQHLGNESRGPALDRVRFEGRVAA